MTTEDALRVIYGARGYVNTYADTPDDREWWIGPNGEIIGYDLPDPIWQPEEGDGDGGLAEFARLVVWALTQFLHVAIFQEWDKYSCEIAHDVVVGEYVGADTPQEAFIRALAAAIEVRDNVRGLVTEIEARGKE